MNCRSGTYFKLLIVKLPGLNPFLVQLVGNLMVVKNLVNFDSIQCVIPEIDRKLLSKDQQYLFDISTAIKSGNCPEDLSIRDPGPLSHARWLTAANRVLRLYASVITPSDEHKLLVSFILKSYMPVWFNIKKIK